MRWHGLARPDVRWEGKQPACPAGKQGPEGRKAAGVGPVGRRAWGKVRMSRAAASSCGPAGTSGGGGVPSPSPSPSPSPRDLGILPGLPTARLSGLPLYEWAPWPGLCSRMTVRQPQWRKMCSSDVASVAAPTRSHKLTKSVAPALGPGIMDGCLQLAHDCRKPCTQPKACRIELLTY